jgi:hypothetical protein
MFTAILTMALAAAPISPTPSSVEGGVLAADAAFWRAFNQCDAEAMNNLLADDVEFYHDKTGLTVGRGAVLLSLMKGPCGTPGMHLRREAVGSPAVDPVPGYGAILSGEHKFYVKQGQTPEYVDGNARFAVVWRQNGNHWEMRRVLSYSHRPAS